MTTMETARLTLRPLEMDDLPDFVAMIWRWMICPISWR